MATVAILSTARPVLQTRVVLCRTTLVESWSWGAVALAVWTATWLFTDVLNIAREGLADQLWFASAILMVTPFTSALGARRPGSRVWSAFIVLPVTIVLFLPAATAWSRDLEIAPLHLEAPMLAGYALVLVMGTGNYLGTRFAASAGLAAAACLLVVVPMSTVGAHYSLARRPSHSLATLLLTAAVWRAAWQARQKSKRPGTTSLDRLWIDFRDLFGIVWARRVLDRLNEAARQGNWPIRLHLHGFVPVEPAKPIALSAEEAEQVDHALRWLLRRFVDPEWIDERLEIRTETRIS